MMTLHKYSKDWEDIYCNWVDHMGQYTRLDALPPDGYIVIKDTKPLLMGWVYVAFGIGIYWISWITPNPDNTPMESALAVKFMLNGISEIMLEQNYNCAFCISDDPALSKTLELMKFQPNHPGMQYWRVWETGGK